MATLDFSFCVDKGCESFRFRDLTGEQPETSSGYLNGQASLYSGVLLIYNSEDEKVREYIVRPSADPTVTRFVPFSAGGQSKLPDGFYWVEYIVKNAGGAEVGRAKFHFQVTCDFVCQFTKKSKKLLSVSSYFNRQEIVRCMAESLVYYTGARALAGEGNVEHAQAVFDSIKENCKC